MKRQGSVVASSKKFKRTGLPVALKNVYQFGQKALSDAIDVIQATTGTSYDGLNKNTLIKALENDFRMATEKAKLVLVMGQDFIDNDQRSRLAKLTLLQEAVKNIKKYGDYSARFDYKARLSTYVDGIDASYHFPDFNDLADGSMLNMDETRLAALHILTFTEAVGNRGRTAQSFVDHLSSLTYTLNRDYLSPQLFLVVESGLRGLKDRMSSPVQFPNAFRSN